MSAVPEELNRLAAALERLEFALTARLDEAEQLDHAAIEAEVESRVENRLPERLAEELAALQADQRHAPPSGEGGGQGAAHQIDQEDLARKVDDAIARLETVLNR